MSLTGFVLLRSEVALIVWIYPEQHTVIAGRGRAHSDLFIQTESGCPWSVRLVRGISFLHLRMKEVETRLLQDDRGGGNGKKEPACLGGTMCRMSGSQDQ